jgi:hypothetical protein
MKSSRQRGLTELPLGSPLSESLSFTRLPTFLCPPSQWLPSTLGTKAHQIGLKDVEPQRSELGKAGFEPGRQQ